VAEVNRVDTVHWAVFQEKTENSWYGGFMAIKMIYYRVKAMADEYFM
jgi:hypothetical protein